VHCRLLAGAIACSLAIPSVGWSYDFAIDVRTVGQGYQVRGYAPDGRNQLLSRRRLTQYLNLNVYDIEPARWKDPTGGRNNLFVDVSLRFDSDFGGYLLGRPRGDDEIRELKQDQVDVLYAFVGGRGVAGRLDFQLGRQIHFDQVDFYSFDGGDAILRVHGPLYAEAFAGTEVRGELPLASPVFELDGTSAGSRDPATRPDQARQLRPLVGGALALDGDGDGDGAGRFAARLAYRRVWSATAQPLPGEPATGVNDEKLALTGSAAWRDRVFATFGVRYNLLVAAFDDQQIAVRVRVAARQWLSAEQAYLAPTFDGDSIWNIFSSGAYRDLRIGYEAGLAPGVRAHARAFLRLFSATPGETVAGQDLGAAAPGGRLAGGGSAGADLRRARVFVRADGYFDDGYGGRKLGSDLSARYALRPGTWEAEWRLTGFFWRSDQQPATNRGVVFGVQVGSRYQLAQGMRLHFLAEDNAGTFYRAQARALALIEVDASL
jgi:hypothetical protein